MTLLLKEADVRALLTMPLALEAVEEAFRELAAGSLILHPRHRIEFPEHAFLHYMAAADLKRGMTGLKIYTYARGRIRFLVPLYRFTTGEMLALLEADYLGQMRTGAASGVATKYMARAGAGSVGIIGTGGQARTQLEAIAAVRKIQRIRAFGRDAERRARFGREMTQKLGVPVESVESAEAAIRGAEIVVTATTASKPVVEGNWLAPGTHINAIGANFAHKSEVDPEAVRRARVIAVDSVEQSKYEAGDLVVGFRQDEARWGEVRELAEIVAGHAAGRTSDADVTLFKSNGVAIEDVAVATRLYELARQRGIGQRLPLWEG